jgi:lipopolysaccharide transport system permease protein
MSIAELAPETTDQHADSADAEVRPSDLVTVIEPRPGWQAVNLAELWKYRELVYFLTWRDIKVRYKQTVMGAAWAIIQPLMTSIVFVILFGKMGGMEAHTTVPYLPLVLTAQIAWQYFAASVTQCGNSLVSSSNLISKVYFPRLIIPMAAVGAGLVDFLIACGLLAVVMLGYGMLPPVQVVLVPLFLLGIIVTSVGVGSFLAALTVAYRDFRYVIGFMIQMWMFATPVGYSFGDVTRILSERGYSQDWLLLYFANPMAGFVQGFRWCLLGEPLPPQYLAISVSVAVVMLFVGAIYFRRTERRFADIV